MITRTKKRSRAVIARLEDIEDLAASGENIWGISRRIGWDPEAIVAFLKRLDRKDLALKIRADGPDRMPAGTIPGWVAPL